MDFKTLDKLDKFQDLFDCSYFRLNKLYLCIIGSWPYQTKKNRYMIPIMMCLGIFTVVVPEVIYLIEIFDDPSKVIDCLMALVLTYGAYVVVINSFMTHTLRETILEGMKENWTKLKSTEEIRIFQQYAQEGKFLILSYSVLCLISLCTFMAVPLFSKLLDHYFPLNETRPMKNFLEVQYHVDPEKYYVPIFLHGVQAAVCVIFILLAFDNYFVMIVQHVCSMFVVLGHRLGKVNRVNSYALNQHSNCERDTSNEIIDCIKYHCNCLRFSRMIENSFAIPFMMQLFSNVAIVSITGVQTLRSTSEPQKILSFGLNTISIIVRLFFLSWAGQKIFDHSSKVHAYLFDVEWYEFTPKTIKSMYIMLIRSLRPSYVTIGKLAPLNFATYCTLIKTSMSIFTLILSTE